MANAPRRALASYGWAVLISATCIGIPAMARAATADSLLNALMALSLLFIWQALWGEPERARWWVRWAALYVGLGLLTKGPIALLVPGAASFIAAIWTHRFRAWLRLVMDPVSWLIALGVAAPWYILQFQAQGIAFIRGFLGLHNIGRFTNTMHGFSAGPLYYPGWILVATLPFTLAVLSALGVAIRRVVGRSEKASEPRGDRMLIAPELRLAWVVFFFVICFFSFSATKLPHYGFYGLALLAGCLALTTLFTLTLASLPLWLGETVNGVRDPYYQEVLRDVVVQTTNLKWWFVSAALAALGAIVVSLKSGRLGLLLAGGVGALTLHGLVVPAVIQSLRGPIREVAAIIRALPEDQRARVVTWRLAAPSLSFEVGSVIPPATPRSGNLVVLPSPLKQDLRSLTQSDLCIHFEQLGISLVEISKK
ncbi:MAG: phospholipid carrier-dependent glycosyltransferase [Betaproteobacteria bacterium]|nr:phospholipid carrier-dependent glycosyltransferase [Betaproteobacteria bacterium]